MKFFSHTFPRKVLTVICAVAILLSCISVSFGAIAEQPASTDTYVVNADTSPAIPMFAGTKINLNTVDVLFAGDEIATSGADITWDLGGDYGQNLILGEDKTLTAFTKGNDYKITATAGDNSAILWVVVAEKTDSAWVLYDIDFDAYTEQYSGLTFERDAEETPDTTSTNKNFTYYSGVWKYNGVEFDSSNIPVAIKLPTDWHSTVRGSAGGVQVQVPHVMPLTINVLDNEPVVERSGIMPFANPYLNDGLNTIDSYGKRIWGNRPANGSGRNDARSMFYISNDKIDSFSDYTVTADFHVFNMNWSEAYPAETRSVGIIGRIPVDANHIPTDAAIANYSIDYYSSGSVINSAGSISFKHQYYGVNIGKTKNYVGQYTVQTNNDQTIYVLPYDADNNAATRDSWGYLNSNGATNASSTSPLAVEGTHLELGVKYAGSNATVFSPADVNNDTFTFNNAVPTKGGVGIYLPNINRKGTNAVADWINVHQFEIALNNNITAENDGSEYPVYEKYYFQPVVDATITESYTDLTLKEFYFNNLPDAINYLDGKAGKIWIKGSFTPDKTKLDGSIENRGEITISGYGDSADGGTFIVPKATYGSGMNGNWTKGDVKFEYITIDAVETSGEYGTDVSITSAGHKITFGKEVETGTYKINIAANTYNGGKDINVDIHSGNYQVISALTNNFFHGSGVNFGPYNMNVNVNIYGGDIDALYTISGSNYNGVNKTNYINGDVVYNVNGGTIKTVNLIGYAYGSDVQVSGDVIFNINGGKITDKIMAQLGHSNLTSNTAYKTPERGNMALVIDAEKVEKAIIGYGHAEPRLDYFKMAEGKYLIGIINNYEKSNGNVAFSTLGYKDKAISETNPSVLDRYDYKITVSGGEAQPVFVRTNPEDPATSFLTGFTITPNAENEDKLVVVNGKDVITAVNGLYDLSAYKSDRTDASDDALITSITFVDAKEMSTTTDELTGQELADLKQSGDVPEKDGYLFAGYYAEGSDKAMTATEFANADTVIAKFIPKAVLGVAWQIAKGEGNTANLRLISTVDSLQYQKVIFTLKVAGRDDMVMESTTVYSSIKGNVNGQEVVYDDPTIFSSASEFFMTHIVSGIPDTFHGAELKVTAKLVTKDDKIIPGDEVSIIIKSADDYEEIFGTANQ